jgi:hypothetical protein
MSTRMPWDPDPPPPKPAPVAAPATNGHADLKQSPRQRSGFSYAADKADQLPPHSYESEQGVIGCILLDPVMCIAEAVAGGVGVAAGNRRVCEKKPMEPDFEIPSKPCNPI